MNTNKSAPNIRFKDDDHPVLELIRLEARKERYVGILGLQEYMRVKYKARLYGNMNSGCTSVTFPDEFTCSEFLLRAGTK